jgi:hypothetical protein
MEAIGIGFGAALSGKIIVRKRVQDSDQNPRGIPAEKWSGW